MPLRLRFLLDTNVLIPLQDSLVALESSLANFMRLVGVGGHQILYHPASEQDIQRDRDQDRRQRTLTRLRQYSVLQAGPPCPWNTPTMSLNDACDNDILYALERDAVHALVTEDQKLHQKAKVRGLGDRVYFIQSAEDWMRRLHEPAEIRLPNILDVELHTIMEHLCDPFFDSIRDGYDKFDGWFRKKAQEGRRAWIYRSENNNDLSAICIYDVQHDEPVTDDGYILTGPALKLCTFKVGEAVRGRKIGELFLRAAFRYASNQHCESIFIHANAQKHTHLIQLLDDFGFHPFGSYTGDQVYVKNHPVTSPAIQMESFEYLKRYYPHYLGGIEIRKFIVPIQPQYHKILFPDYNNPGEALPQDHPHGHVGNAIKLAYLCHTPNKQLRTGDVVLFYRTHDLKALTTLGVVEKFEISTSPDKIARLVSRRTVYSEQEIVKMAERETKVILFRLIRHFSTAVSYETLRRRRIVYGPIQSILKITDAAFSKILQTT